MLCNFRVRITITSRGLAPRGPFGVAARGLATSLGHAASSNPKGLGVRLSLSTEVANNLAKSSCCLTKS